MGIKTRVFFTSSALVLALAYYIIPIFPDTANKPILKSVVGTVFNLIFLMAKVGHHLGIASEVNITRAMFGAFSMLDDGGNGSVVQSTETIDGVRVLIFRPKGEVTTRRPGVVYYHGGGWTFMTPETYAPISREIAERTQSVLISVDYRLSPEHIFPAAFDDCLSVTKSFLRNADNYGVDPDMIGIMGDSAGGNLAMAVALALAREKESSLPQIRLQALIYPALQAFDFDLPAYIEHGDGPGILHKQTMILYWLSYAFGNHSLYTEFASNTHISDELRHSKYGSFVSASMLPRDVQERIRGQRTYPSGNKTLSDKIEKIILDSRFAPLMASDDDLALLPPTYILTTEFDVLRDDCFLAVERLRKVDVPVEHSYLAGEEHGCVSTVTMDDNAKEEIRRLATFFNKTIL